ncbi:hypothetical protein BGW80DRAFT_1323170 [Lactifluus volemus]|nr:hypothetical protein BGW80DRAFT_1323170 [Lactifluus volemus]
MPTRGLRPNLTRTHSRTSSSGSSKVVLNLQLTQKDPVQPKIDKARRTGHTFETVARANVTRTGGTARVQSREHVPSAAPRRVSNLQPPRSGKPKAGFTIAASTVASDDDEEWISSESGAVTPMDTASENTTRTVPTPVDLTVQRTNGQNLALAPGTTPRAEAVPSRPRVQTNGFVPTLPPHVAAPTARIPSSSKQNQYPQNEQEPYRPRLRPLLQSQLDPAQSVHKSLSPQSPPPHTPDAVPVVSGARTEPPTPTSPRSDRHSSSKARPSSTRSLIAEHAHHLRPHPLIRGQSFGHAHLAPLKVSSDAAQAQLSSSPPNQARDLPALLDLVRAFGCHVTHSHSHSINNNTPPNYERGRTYSTISTTSTTSAALSSLAQLPTRASLNLALNYAPVHFPPQQNSQHAHSSENIHALLPPPYVTPHFTILQWRSPIRESHDRVARAREAQRSGRRGV